MSELIDRVRMVLCEDSRNKTVSDVLEDLSGIPQVSVCPIEFSELSNGPKLTLGAVYGDGVALKPGEHGGNYAYLHRNNEKVAYILRGPAMEFRK